MRKIDPTREAWGDDPPAPCACGVPHIEGFCITCEASVCELHLRRCDSCSEVMCPGHARPLEECHYCLRCIVAAMVDWQQAKEAAQAAQAAMERGEGDHYFGLAVDLIRVLHRVEGRPKVVTLPMRNPPILSRLGTR